MNDSDWTLLNLYADGEMNPAEAEAFAGRIDREPALRSALADLIETKAQMRAVFADEETPDFTANASHPRTDAASLPQPDRMLKTHTMAFAAGIACAAAIFTALQFADFRPDTWQAQIVSIHDNLTDRSYAVDSRKQVKLAPGRRFGDLMAPDLSSSALYFAGLEDRSDYLALHYRGMNGCSLTVVARERNGTRADVMDTASSDRHLIEIWHGVDYDYAVISEGMDSGRFESVYRYIRSEFQHQQERRANLQIAMQDAYKRAAPCA
ncbi:MAG: hypothetical protein RIM72_06545 [Alphaproteobacteria bacterium]